VGGPTLIRGAAGRGRALPPRALTPPRGTTSRSSLCTVPEALSTREPTRGFAQDSHVARPRGPATQGSLNSPAFPSRLSAGTLPPPTATCSTG
jgi:hypothetical protein